MSEWHHRDNIYEQIAQKEEHIHSSSKKFSTSSRYCLDADKPRQEKFLEVLGVGVR
jgi:hypothetical protein